MATARTVSQVIERAFRLLGIPGAGQSLSPSDAATGLEVLQDLLAEHAGDFFVPVIVQEYLDLTAGTASYTIGENGTPSKDTQRPEQIIGAFIRSSGYDYPVDIISEEAYRAVVDKTTQGRPEELYYDPTAPNGTIYCYPVPDSSSYDLYISSLKSLEEPTGLTQDMLDDVNIPRMYVLPLAWMLCVDLAQEYGYPVSLQMERRAERGESSLISVNAARMAKPAGFEISRTTSRGRRTSILSY